ncbi:ParB/RepB/Spo0J family partition protein [Rhodococcus aetherivorans]|uniref:ParB/RepB/Spo0J family partition protein n=1 Tax=Rhodococcus aetherivorans TaxID=191292 RepID=UPI00163A690B|nr:ParB/RepB/Spo0J family partition protein [Rhodococcus aetherivorans]MBC2592343.1 ParB/RepB/Spo0J family partition protein [Rhodococcus aetherivorans]
MARGTRTSLASLAAAVGEHSPVDRHPQRSVPTTAPLTDLVANPRNPRDDLGDLSDLASIAETQLQPVLVVTREVYLRLYPQDETALAEARWVVINGCRRFAAAAKFGRSRLDIVVKDEVAHDRATLLAAAVTENIGRRDFDVIEEAKAVELLVTECGRADAAAARLGKTEGWVSQRRALLKLAPELQTALRRGELAVRHARSLARVPLEQQVDFWQAQQNKTTGKEDAGDVDPPRNPHPRADAAKVVRAFRRLDADPPTLADALRDYLDEDGLRALIDALAVRT